MMVRRGDVYYADLAGSVGSEQGGLRPVVVIQNDKEMCIRDRHTAS